MLVPQFRSHDQGPCHCYVILIQTNASPFLLHTFTSILLIYCHHVQYSIYLLHKIIVHHHQHLHGLMKLKTMFLSKIYISSLD